MVLQLTQLLNFDHALKLITLFIKNVKYKLKKPIKSNALRELNKLKKFNH
jgi:hypothetical protein